MLNLIKKKNNFNIQMNVIEEKRETPQCDDCIYEFNGESIIISKEINDIVLNDFNQRFKLIDFSNFDEKNVIEYFYHKEKSNIEHIDLNFKDDQKICKCLKFFIGKLIEDKYQYNTTLINQRNNIEKKLNEILHEIEICADIDNYNLSKAYFKKLKTDKLPKFLEKIFLTQ